MFYVYMRYVYIRGQSKVKRFTLALENQQWTKGAEPFYTLLARCPLLNDERIDDLQFTVLKVPHVPGGNRTYIGVGDCSDLPVSNAEGTAKFLSPAHQIAIPKRRALIEIQNTPFESFRNQPSEGIR